MWERDVKHVTERRFSL
jgi:hypothetical protein